jgi:ribosomal protein L7/L12
MWMWYGVRVVGPGPNRLAVISRLRQHLNLSPTAGKELVDHGLPVVLLSDEPRGFAEALAEQFRALGAEVEVFVSSSLACGTQ